MLVPRWLGYVFLLCCSELEENCLMYLGVRYTEHISHHQTLS